jgi:hypothetical protein
MEKTIQQLQSDIEAALQSLRKHGNQLPEELKPILGLAPPEGSRVQVSFRHGKNNRNSRQVKRSAPSHSWSSDAGLISISYEEFIDEQGGAAEIPATRPPAAQQPSTLVQDPARDLLLALAGAEQDPALGFIALKWFRDTYLTRQTFPWIGSEENRQRVLVDAINRNWIVTSKVPNPKNPHYPVTAIRVNRSLPEVRSMLNSQQGFGSAFSPIKLAGEPLSDTVLRERR